MGKGSGERKREGIGVKGLNGVNLGGICYSQGTTAALRNLRGFCPPSFRLPIGLANEFFKVETGDQQEWVEIIDLTCKSLHLSKTASVTIPDMHLVL